MSAQPTMLKVGARALTEQSGKARRMRGRQQSAKQLHWLSWLTRISQEKIVATAVDWCAAVDGFPRFCARDASYAQDCRIPQRNSRKIFVHYNLREVFHGQGRQRAAIERQQAV